MDSNQLIFALEPEAAALYCQTLASDKWDEKFKADDQDADFSTGTKYMIIDAGGMYTLYILTMYVKSPTFL